MRHRSYVAIGGHACLGRPHAHERVAWRVLEALGEPVAADWRAPWPEPEVGPVPWRARQADDLRWLRDHVMPWIRRRLRGAQPAERFLPERPTLRPL